MQHHLKISSFTQVKFLETALVPNLQLLSILEINLAKEWYVFQYSQTKGPRHNLYLLTPVLNENFEYCTVWNTVLPPRAQWRNFPHALICWSFLKVRHLRVVTTFWIWALWLFSLMPKGLFSFPASCLFLVVIAKMLTPRWMDCYCNVILLKFDPALLF